MSELDVRSKMKPIPFIVLLICTQLSLLAEDVEKIEEITTTEGKTYRSVTIREVTPSQIKIFHESGVTSVNLSELPPELQKQFGYDPEKAKEHMDKLQADAKRKADALQQRRQEAWLRLPVTKRFSIKPERSDGISLRYEDYHHLAQEERDKARNERISQERLDARLATIPKGGHLIVTVHRSTIGAANTKYFLVIVTDSSGKEIVRRYGPDDIAETPSTAGGSWWNLFLVNIPKDIGSGVKIRVVDRLDNDASDFTLRPTK